MNKHPWSPSSWRQCPIRQLPIYPNIGRLEDSERRLAASPALIFPGEISQLRQRLSSVALGEAFLLQGGDCAESFDDFGHAPVESTFRVILQMAVVLTYAAACPVVAAVVAERCALIANREGSAFAADDSEPLGAHIGASILAAFEAEPDAERAS